MRCSFLFVLAFSFLIAAKAQAGDCPTCTSSADCGGAGNFCVLHDEPVGCGDLTQLCCPGQGCNAFSGRPSCESAGTCVVVDEAPIDAGVRDSGTTPTDSGVPDAGGGLDAGAPVDGGSSLGQGSCGCGCDVATSTGTSGAMSLLLALAALVVVIRSKRIGKRAQ